MYLEKLTLNSPLLLVCHDKEMHWPDEYQTVHLSNNLLPAGTLRLGQHTEPRHVKQIPDRDTENLEGVSLFQLLFTGLM